MSLFRVFVDGQLFYHPHLSQLSITEAKVQEDAENIDSLTLSAPFNHPYLSSIQPMASTIVCKKDDLTVFEGRALDDGTDFYNTHTWTCESCLAYLKDTMQPPFSYHGPLRGLLEQFLSVHNAAVEEKKRFTLGTVTVTDNNDYINYSNSDYSVTLDAIQDKLIKTHGGYLQVRYTEDGKMLDYLEDFPDQSLQTVEFGKNLTDVKITRDHTERVTALIPLGAKLTETDEDGNILIPTKSRATTILKCVLAILNGLYVDGVGTLQCNQLTSPYCGVRSYVWNDRSYFGYSVTFSTVMAQETVNPDCGW